MRALSAAQANYEACPESARIYKIEEALRLLVEFVVFSIPVAVRAMDYDLLRSLAPLLEPFAPLSPILHAIWQNALATFESSCCGRYFQARARWIEVLERLATAQGAEFRHVEQVRHAILFGLGTVEAMFGMPSAEERVASVEGNPLQQVGVLQLRKIVRLEQGDWKEAARLDRLADELALRTRAPSMFLVHVLVELKTYAQARDLAGIKRVAERIEPLALRFPPWESHLITARALFELVRGDFSAAIQGFEAAIAETEPDAVGRSTNLSGWIQAETGLAEALLLSEQLAETRDRARAAIERCKALQIASVTDGLLRAWAVAEAKLGNFETALAAIQELINQQRELGIAGLKLGLSYEACARIAIVSGDEDEFDRFARLTAREYRHGAGSPLGARYDALLNEARRRGFDPSPQIGSLDPPAALR
jgi:tetratricopeptide (TPR) repeat protein